MGLGISPLTAFDLQNLISFIPYFNKKKNMQLEKNEDYTILVTTYNSKIPLGNIEFLNKYKDKVIICDDGSKNPEFLAYLKELEKRGFNIVFNGHKKYIKWEFLKKVLLSDKDAIPSREVALKEGLEYVKTKYTLFLDDDSYPEIDLAYAVAVLERENADLSSTKVYPSNNKRMIEQLQAIEYESAMLAREVRPYLTSGACLIGKTSSLKKIMKNHSMFYQGGDIEVGVLAKKLKMKIIHTDVKIYTEVPNTIKKWARQRSFWASGSFRHTFVNSFNYMFDPLHIFYFTFMIWLFLFFKWYTNFSAPLSILLVLLIYIPLTFISNLRIAKRIWKYKYALLLFPIYASFQVLILPFAGIFLYFRQAMLYKNWGIIKWKQK